MSTAVEVPLVNFMLIGVQKGGTTALAQYLAEHPHIFLPAEKELHILDDGEWPGVASVMQVNAAYRPHLAGLAGQPLVGEATPSYLWLPQVVTDIACYNPAPAPDGPAAGDAGAGGPGGAGPRLLRRHPGDGAARRPGLPRTSSSTETTTAFGDQPSAATAGRGSPRGART